MRLPNEFYRLPLRFDVERLCQELRDLPPAAWSAHPSDYEGNSSVRLISVGGREEDDVRGEMRPTPHLLRSPYIQQVLASFGVVWSRSRLMKLSPRSSVPEHADINYHWFSRVRVHIPIVTRPEVSFHCGAQSVHMAAGEAWIFDNWRKHRVENPTDDERIHLVADTSGSAAFWQMVAQGMDPQAPPRFVQYEPGKNVRLLTERDNTPLIMPPSEVELLVGDLHAELYLPDGGEAARTTLLQFKVLLDGFCRQWRQLWSLYGDSPGGWQEFVRLRDAIREQAAQRGASICAKTNDVPVLKILEGRVLQYVVNLPAPPTANARQPSSIAAPRFERPLIIVAAPRSGSTLLFETLACSSQLWTVGGEAHWLVELIPELRPGAPGVDSNRLAASHYSETIATAVRRDLAQNLRTAAGNAWQGEAMVRLLEKTPKNSLRIPFFDRLFPDARFIFLWRDPRENISSIMEGWRAGRWITYPRLEGWEGPWAFLLPPGWQALRGKALEEVAAFQWECTNRTILQDLEALPRERWQAVNYADLIRQPREAVQRLCRFGEIEFDDALAARVAGSLPLSTYTLTPPQPDKWQKNGEAIARVLPGVEKVWDALKNLSLQSPKR